METRGRGYGDERSRVWRREVEVIKTRGRGMKTRGRGYKDERSGYGDERSGYGDERSRVWRLEVSV